MLSWTNSCAHKQQEELERLDIFNEVLNTVNDGALHRAPIGESPHRILDVGAGTGIWAIDMGDRYPSAEIIGVDINPNMPAYVPPNVRFEVEDVEKTWTHRLPFDYIHCRYMTGAISNWPKLIAQCFEFVHYNILLFQF